MACETPPLPLPWPIGTEPQPVVPEPKEFNTVPAIALAAQVALRQIHALVRPVKQARCEAR
jgi:hypothetical protein